MDNDIKSRSLLSPEKLYPELYNDFTSIENFKFIREVLNSSSLICAIINKHRQILLSNFHLHDKVALRSIEELIGKSPGEVLSCLFSVRKRSLWCF